ncbi:MAG: tryptophan 7-halogenase [Henriciella sp.]
MTAAALIHRFGENGFTQVRLIESTQIGTIGVGEATVPAIREFLSKLGIDEIDFVRRTNATFKLAIKFEGWAEEGQSFYHPFADHGVPVAKVPFMSLWTKLKQRGAVDDIDAFNLGAQLAKQDKFAIPRKNPATGNSLYNYAFHFDAKLAADYLASWSQMSGVDRIEGTVETIQQNSESGLIESVTLQSGEVVNGDLFIDCTGFYGLLIEQVLKTGYQSWSRWLPCDRAVAQGCETTGLPPSATRALAQKAGWQWRIPLQNRIGNGHVYCSDYTSDEAALKDLEDQLTGKTIAEPKQLTFTTGVRNKFWHKNVYAIGLSAGFLEPLESTGIYLIQTGISLLLSNFPSKNHNQALQDEVNYGQMRHWERIRDFIILHYKLNGRQGDPFWEYCREMSIPDDLAANIQLFRQTGRLRVEHSDFFQRSSWVSMFAGFGIVPERYHPSADDFEEAALIDELNRMSQSMAVAADQAPSHDAFIEKNCSALALA